MGLHIAVPDCTAAGAVPEPPPPAPPPTAYSRLLAAHAERLAAITEAKSAEMTRLQEATNRAHENERTARAAAEAELAATVSEREASLAAEALGAIAPALASYVEQPSRLKLRVLASTWGSLCARTRESLGAPLSYKLFSIAAAVAQGRELHGSWRSHGASSLGRSSVADLSSALAGALETEAFAAADGLVDDLWHLAQTAPLGEVPEVILRCASDGALRSVALE